MAAGEIDTATLTITANHETKIYGTANPTLSYQVSGLQSGDTAGAVLSGGLARASGEGVGYYAITQDGLAANGNYTISFAGNYLDITNQAWVDDNWVGTLSFGDNVTLPAGESVTLPGTASPNFTFTYGVDAFSTISGTASTPSTRAARSMFWPARTPRAW